MPFSVEWSFNIGTMLFVVFTAGGFYAVTKVTLDTLTKSINEVKDGLKDSVTEVRAELKDITKTLAAVAIQDDRINTLQKTVASQNDELALLQRQLFDMARGRGWVQQDVDGEYLKKARLGPLPGTD